MTYCAFAVSAKIRVILTKILTRNGIAVQWNAGGGGVLDYMANQGRHVLKIYLRIPPTNLEGLVEYQTLDRKVADSNLTRGAVLC